MKTFLRALITFLESSFPFVFPALMCPYLLARSVMNFKRFNIYFSSFGYYQWEGCSQYLFHHTVGNETQSFPYLKMRKFKFREAKYLPQVTGLEGVKMTETWSHVYCSCHFLAR